MTSRINFFTPLPVIAQPSSGPRYQVQYMRRDGETDAIGPFSCYEEAKSTLRLIPRSQCPEIVELPR